MKRNPENGYLRLTRETGESITIGNDVVVKLIRSENGRAVLGVSAPKSITVDRTEVANRKRSQS